MIHALLIEHNLEDLNVEEMVNLATALMEQVTLDVQEIGKAIIKDCEDGQKRESTS